MSKQETTHWPRRDAGRVLNLNHSEENKDSLSTEQIITSLVRQQGGTVILGTINDRWNLNLWRQLGRGSSDMST